MVRCDFNEFFYPSSLLYDVVAACWKLFSKVCVLNLIIQINEDYKKES